MEIVINLAIGRRYFTTFMHMSLIFSDTDVLQQTISQC